MSIEGCPSGTLGFLFGELGSRRTVFGGACVARSSVAMRSPIRASISADWTSRARHSFSRERSGFAASWRTSPSSHSSRRNSATHRARRFSIASCELDAAWAERVAAARRDGNVLRYRAHVTATSIAVGLAAVPSTDRLGVLHGTDNQFTFTTSRYLTQPLVISGPGAGPAVTAAGVYNDLLRLDRSRDRRHARRPERAVNQRTRNAVEAERVSSRARASSRAKRGIPRAAVGRCLAALGMPSLRSG